MRFWGIIFVLEIIDAVDALFLGFGSVHVFGPGVGAFSQYNVVCFSNKKRNFGPLVVSYLCTKRWKN